VRIVTDPTFEAAGTVYRTSAYELRRTIGPALPPEAVQPVDVVLLSHDPRPRASIVIKGGTTFHFVTDGIHASLERALQAAEGRDAGSPAASP
jgi:hypothetical protein